MTRSRARNYNKEVILLHQAFCDYCSTIEGEPELSRNKHRTIYPTTHIVPSHWCHDQDPASTPVYSDSPDEEEEDFPMVPLDDKHWTSEIVPERTFCIHKNGLPNNLCQHPCPYGSNDTVSYMDSLALNDISDYEDYMVTSSDEELLGMEKIPY